MAQKAWQLGLHLLLEEPVSPPTMWTPLGSTPGTPPCILGDRVTAGCVSLHACARRLIHTHTLTLTLHTGFWCQAPWDTAEHTRLTRGRDEDAISGGAAVLRQGGSCRRPRGEQEPWDPPA